MQGLRSALCGRYDTRGIGVYVHLSTVEGFVDFFFFAGGGGGVNCGLVCPIWLGEDAFVLIIQVHLGNSFPSYETSEKVVQFIGAQWSCNM